MSNNAPPRQLGQGFYWQDLMVGQQFRTFRRTVTEADLVGFIGVTGMLEVMFIDAEPLEGGIAGRPDRGGDRSADPDGAGQGGRRQCLGYCGRCRLKTGLMYPGYFGQNERHAGRA